MDFGILQQVIDSLRGKPAAPAAPAAPPAQSPVGAGVSAAANPKYAAYKREAVSMGEPVMSPEEFAKMGAK